MAKTKLLDLPEELISNITARLGSDDVFALRLSCKTIEAKSFHGFATEYFGEKCVQFTTDSLKVLLHIARSSRLRGFVKEFHVITVRFAEDALHLPEPTCSRCCWHPTVRQIEAYRTYAIDQEKLKASGADKAMLEETFANLPSLKLISLVDSAQSLGGSTDYRGSLKVPRTTGYAQFYPSNSPRYRTWLSHVFKTLMQALVSSNSAISKLKTDFIDRTHGIGADEMAIGKPALQKLSTIFTTISTLQLQFKSSQALEKVVRGGTHVGMFGQLFTNLTSLSLRFDFEKHSNLLCVVFLDAIKVTKLQALRLDGLQIRENLLSKFLAKAVSIIRLELNCVNLLQGTWTTILKILMKLPELNHLHLMYLLEAGLKAYFLTQRDISVQDEWVTDEGGDDANSDNDTPDLEPPVDDDAAAASNHSNSNPVSSELPDSSEQQVDDVPDFIPEGASDCSERGYCVCINNRGDVQRLLPLFIKEYNLGQDLGAADAAFALPTPIPLPAFLHNTADISGLFGGFGG